MRRNRKNMQIERGNGSAMLEGESTKKNRQKNVVDKDF